MNIRTHMHLADARPEVEWNVDSYLLTLSDADSTRQLSVFLTPAELDRLIYEATTARQGVLDLREQSEPHAVHYGTLGESERGY